MAEPNLLYIKQLASGNQSFENRILEVLKRELPEEIKDFHEFINSGVLEQAADLVHKIKHKVSLLGMEKGYGLTASFEENLREGDQSLLEEFESILKKMTTFLDNINLEPA